MRKTTRRFLTVIFALLLIPCMCITTFAGATDVNVISQASAIGDDAYGLTDGRDFRVSDGKNTYRAYCSEHDMPTPEQGTKITSVSETTNSALRKVLYYGYGGPGYDQSLFTGTIFPGYTLGTKDFIAITTLMASDANGHSSGVDNSEYTALYNKIIGKSAPPATFKVYMAYTSGSTQNLVFAVNNPQGYAYLVKTSANTSISGNDSDYSLAGAVYKVYSDKACKTSVGTLTTGSNGTTNTLTLSEGTYYVKEATAPKGYKLDTTVYTATVKDGETTKISAKDTPIPKRNITLNKTSANTECSDGNDCYTLKGAVYGVYSDSGCTKLVTKLTTDENGKASVKLFEGKYYIKEITAPTGYALDKTVYTADISSKDVTLNVEDQPVNDPAGITLSKIDKDSKQAVPSGAASLEGAQFEVLYYAGYYTKDNLPETPTRRWVYETKAVTNEQTGEIKYRWILGDQSYFVEGDELYRDSYNNKPCIPLGTVMIREIKAPEGYLIEDAVYTTTDGEEVEMPYVAQVTQNGDVAYLQGGNVPVVKEQVERGDFFLKKTDDEGNALAGVEFIITSVETGESHTITTDENGYFSSKAEYAESTGTERLWFGSEETNDAVGALPYGNYTIEEVHGTSNRGLTMKSGSFTIDENDIELDLSMTNEAPEFTLTTKAVNKLNGLQVATATDKDLVLSDTITLTNVYLWDSAKVKVWAVDKETGEKVKDATGEYIEMTEDVDFEYDTENPTMEIEVDFDFDFSNLEGKDIVFFSEAIVTDRNGEEKVICEGKDINDAAETISFAGIGTTAKDKKDGDATLDLSKKATITDTVAYKGLKAGTKYKLEGVLMDKGTGKEVLVDGKKVTSSKIFTAETSEGTVDVEFTLNTTDLAGKTIVVFENLYEIPEGEEDITVTDKTTPTASHEDINSVDQTLKVVEKTPTTGDMNKTMPYVLLIAGAGIVIAGALIFKKKKAK